MEVAATEVDEQSLEAVPGASRNRHGRGDERRPGDDRRRARPVEGDGRRRPAHHGRDRRAHRRLGALRPRVGVSPGGERLRRRTTPTPRRSSCRPSRRWRSPTRTARSTCWAATTDQLGLQGPRRSYRALPRRSRIRLARARPPSSSWAPSSSSGPGYRAHLVAEWIPALEGVEDKLRQGGKVADIGCGHGVSTILMAQAFPESSSTASTTTTPRSSGRARSPRARGSPTTRNSMSQPPRTIPARAMTWSASSTASTTWATR